MNKAGGVFKKILAVIMFLVGTLFLAVGISFIKSDTILAIVFFVFAFALLSYPIIKIREHILAKKSEGKNWVALPIFASLFTLFFVLVGVLASNASDTEKLKTPDGSATADTVESQVLEEQTEENTTCDHVWSEADCTKPKTCTVCGMAEGEALGHTWIEASCTEPKTCSVCGATEGNALGHDTPDLSCTEADVCERCGEEIQALGHDWHAATCTEPQTCSRCGLTEGKENGHSPADSVRENETPAKCTESGKYDEVVYCSVCHEELSRKTVEEDPLGHTTTNGVCTRCGNEVYETVSGNGDDVVSDITVRDGIYKVHFTYSGSHNFAVWVHDANGDKDLAVNEIGKFDGYYFLLGKAPYTFEIETSGKWTYTIERLSITDATSFEGKGYYVTDIFTASSGTWHITHDGDDNFVVWLYTSSGRELLVNEIGEYDGKKLLEIPSGSSAILVIEADGNWTITPA